MRGSERNGEGLPGLDTTGAGDLSSPKDGMKRTGGPCSLGIATHELPESLCCADAERYFLHLLERHRSDYPLYVRSNVSCLDHLVYEGGEFVGLAFTCLLGAVSLPEYLKQSVHNRVHRHLVALNFCALIAQLKGIVSLGRLVPERILVDPVSCRVFLLDPLLLVEPEIEFELYRDFSEARQEDPNDVLLIVYSLVLRTASFDAVEDVLRSSAVFDQNGIQPYGGLADGRSLSCLEDLSRFRLRCLRPNLYVYSCLNQRGLRHFWFNEANACRESLRYGRFSGHYPSWCVSSDVSPWATREARAEVAKDTYRKLSTLRVSGLVRVSDCLARGVSFFGPDRKRDEELKSRCSFGYGRGFNGETIRFFAITFGASLLLGCYSMLRGFSPLESPLYALGLFGSYLEPTSAWQYVPSALIGSLVWDIAAVRKAKFDTRGLAAIHYLGSILVVVLFMLIALLIYLGLGGLT